MKEELVHLQQAILRENKTQLCEKDLDAITKWKPALSRSMAKELHPEGEMEMVAIAERFQRKFPNLLGVPYHPSLYHFRTTNTQRTKQSALFYATGLFNRAEAIGIDYFVTEDEAHDPLIRFYKLCPRWIKEVKKSPFSRKEFNKFTHSSLMMELRLNVTQYLGLDDLLSQDAIDQMYTACTFEQAWQPNRFSPWCSMFSSDQLHILEYREDLEYYWIDGPGYEVNYKQACVLLADMYKNFYNYTRGRVTDQEEEAGIFYFSHSGTLLKLISFLDVFNEDGYLTSDGYPGPGEDWSWRTSRLSPFAGNVAFVLQHCTKVPHPVEYYVGLYVNENLAQLPFCLSEWCTWEEFSQAFETKLDSCNFNSTCRIPDAAEDDDEEILAVADDRY